MALKKDIAGGTLYYYGVVRRVMRNKPGAQEGVGHYVDFDLWLKDAATTNPQPDRLEQTMTYHLPSAEMDTTAQDPAWANTYALAYAWIKSNIPLFADFVDA